MNLRRWVGIAVIATMMGCGGGDDDSGEATDPPAPATPSVSVGAPTSVTVAAVAQGGQAESAAIALDFNVAAPGNYQCDAHAVQGTEVRDAQMAIVQGANELARDDDSGEGFDARIIRQLTPGAYTLRVWEWRGRDAQITVTCIPAPAAPTNPTTITVGQPVTVNVIAGQGPGSQADLNLTIAAPGTYQCDASSQGLDAQLNLLQNGTEIARDSDSGDGFNARITRELAPGTYVVRAWEWQHRPAAIQVQCTPAVAVPSAGPPIADGGALTLGQPATATIPAGEGPAGQVHVNLVIAAAGTYTCDAVSSDRDAQMAIVQGGNVIVQDSDSGEGTNSRITHDLQPGAYQIRLWEWLHRPTQITVTCRPGS